MNKNCVFASLVFPLEDVLEKILWNVGEHERTKKSYGFFGITISDRIGRMVARAYS